MMKYHNVRVGCFDTTFYGFHTLKDELDILSFEFQGGGGTYYEPTTNYTPTNTT